MIDVEPKFDQRLRDVINEKTAESKAELVEKCGLSAGPLAVYRERIVSGTQGYLGTFCQPVMDGGLFNPRLTARKEKGYFVTGFPYGRTYALMPTPAGLLAVAMQHESGDIFGPNGQVLTQEWIPIWKVNDASGLYDINAERVMNSMLRMAST